MLNNHCPKLKRLSQDQTTFSSRDNQDVKTLVSGHSQMHSKGAEIILNGIKFPKKR